MKTIGVKYLRAKNKEVANGLDLVIQTDGMQLVGVARLFSRTDRGEEGRKMYLEDKTEPYFFAKAVGYRVYISLHSTLADYYSQEEVMENKYEIHHYLQECQLVQLLLKLLKFTKLFQKMKLKNM